MPKLAGGDDLTRLWKKVKCLKKSKKLWCKIPLQFEQFTQEFEVKFYTGIPSTLAFKCLFEFVLHKAQNMQYWRGAKQTQVQHTRPSSAFDKFVGSSVKRIKTGPERKLSLEKELLLTLMKLRLALLVDDLAFTFKVSHGSVSSIFITSVKLLSKELSILIIWPSRSQVRNNLPHCFKKLYPKVRCIIDCLSALQTQQVVLTWLQLCGVNTSITTHIRYWLLSLQMVQYHM